MIEKIIQENLNGEHRQERQKQDAAGHAEHIAEVRAGSLRRYFIALANAFRPSRIPSRRTLRLPSSKRISAASFATSTARDSDSELREDLIAAPVCCSVWFGGFRLHTISQVATAK
jgi:hypothetical protein